MTRLRQVAVAAVLAAVTMIAAPVSGHAMPETSATDTSARVTTLVVAQDPSEPGASTEPGPTIDPAESERANSAKTRTNFIVGGIALVLLLTVIWGRRVRTKRRNAA